MLDVFPRVGHAILSRDRLQQLLTIQCAIAWKAVVVDGRGQRVVCETGQQRDGGRRCDRRLQESRFHQRSYADRDPLPPPPRTWISHAVVGQGRSSRNRTAGTRRQGHFEPRTIRRVAVCSLKPGSLLPAGGRGG